MENNTKRAPVKWAQTKNNVTITVETPGLSNHKVEIKPEGRLIYSGERDKVTYGFDIELHGELDIDKSKWNAKGRNTIFTLVKKNPGPFWPFLTKDSKKDPNIKADWSKWIDEDDEEKKPEGNWDPDNMGMGQDDFKSDSDDDEEEAKADLGDLEKEARPEEKDKAEDAKPAEAEVKKPEEPKAEDKKPEEAEKKPEESKPTESQG
eukprot:TRINITY_DN7090_c0_g2_i10.p1 TRINITY_DN7090_c0_g2~~TRINITY_DN7090_c0_g2_i10.p1  ORF type:complete len:206 (+),score=70.26 TRINITY_DN7090_c0_g2_i10:100-717(+)